MFSKIAIYTSILFLITNLVCVVLAFAGWFYGRDILPILIGFGFTTLILLSLFFKFRQKFKVRLFLFLLVALSSFSTIYIHFNIYTIGHQQEIIGSGYKRLMNKAAPDLHYMTKFNFPGKFQFNNILSGHQYVIVNFWGTWCPPCLKEMPLLEKFYEKNKNRGIAVIGFTDFDQSKAGQMQKIETMIAKLGVSYPILVDNSDAVRMKYGGEVLPITVLIDNSGTIIDYRAGVDGAKSIMKAVSGSLH